MNKRESRPAERAWQFFTSIEFLGMSKLDSISYRKQSALMSSCQSC